MSRGSILALAAAVSLGSCGCGGGENAKYRVVVIPKGLTHEFWQSVHRGAKRAAADLTANGVPVQVTWDGPARENETKLQIDVVNRAVGRQASGIVLAPQHSKLLVDAVRNAVASKIPVVVIDSGLDDTDSIVKYVATDNYNGGRLAAERLLAVLRDEEKKEAPRLVLFRYEKGSESTEQREQGFLDFVQEVNDRRKAAGKPEVTFVSSDFELGSTVEEARKRSLTHLPNRMEQTDGIFTPNESSTEGVLQAISGIPKPGHRVRFVGFDATSKEVRNAVRNGDLDGVVAQDPYKMGYVALWTMVQHLEGKNVAPGGKKTYGTGEYLITRENLDADASRGLYDEEAQSKRTIDPPSFAAGNQ